MGMAGIRKRRQNKKYKYILIAFQPAVRKEIMILGLLGFKRGSKELKCS